MLPFSRWKWIVCVALLFYALTTWADEQPGPQKHLQFGTVAEMKRRGQTASVDFRAELKVTLRKTSGSKIGQPSRFEVEVLNTGTLPTPADASFLVSISSAAMEEYGLLFGALVPKEKRTVGFEHTPLLPWLDVEVAEGIWDSHSMGWTEPRAKERFVFQYPSQPLNDYLPVRRCVAERQVTRLPTKLSDVPEVALADPVPDDIEAPEGRFQVASALAKIKYVNQKKVDAYTELLLSRRTDLVSLPFVLGDACRRKGESKTQFATISNKFRTIQRTEGRVTDVAEAIDKLRPIPAAVQVAALWQMMAADSEGNRLGLVKYLHGSLPEADAAQALAKLAIFSEEESVRSAAVEALKTRRKQNYAEILVNGLDYPWPAVAERSSLAIASLGRTDLLPQLETVLKKPDPRAPQTNSVDGKEKIFVRELVRINHLRNCMLCHAPAPECDGAKVVTSRNREGETLTRPGGTLDDITAGVPIPGETIEEYFGESIPELRIRFDVTYLRQDFSLLLPVAGADPWPSRQRFDFVVRKSEVNEQEAKQLRESLAANGQSPYHRAARTAISMLSRPAGSK